MKPLPHKVEPGVVSPFLGEENSYSPEQHAINKLIDAVAELQVMVRILAEESEGVPVKTQFVSEHKGVRTYTTVIDDEEKTYTLADLREERSKFYEVVKDCDFSARAFLDWLESQSPTNKQS